MLSNQPQGGFITRKPTADVTVVSDDFWGGGGLGTFFPPPPNRNAAAWHSRVRAVGPYCYQPQGLVVGRLDGASLPPPAQPSLKCSMVWCFSPSAILASNSPTAAECLKP